MRVLKFDRELQEMKASVESIEDLWQMQKLIEKKDVLLATSFRRFKSDDLQRADSGEKKLVNLEIEVESVEIAESANKLRVSGKILGGSPPEFVSKGSFHTVDLELRSVFTLRKQFLPYHLKLIEEAKRKAREIKALIVVMDDRKALMALLRNNGVKFAFELENPGSKRDAKRFEEEKKAFFSELLKAIESEKAERILISSPGFDKEDFAKYAREKNSVLEKQFLYEHVSNAEKSAVFELLKRGALEKLVAGRKVQEEFEALEKLKASLGKNDGKCCYGIDEVRKAVELRAVELFMIEDALLRKEKELNSLMQDAENSGAKILIFNSEDDAGTEFGAFKVAALLRYRLN